jgi:hypothetical protein
MYVGLKQKVYILIHKKKKSLHYLFFTFYTIFVHMHIDHESCKATQSSISISKYMSWKHCLWFGESIVFKVFDLWVMI